MDRRLQSMKKNIEKASTLEFTLLIPMLRDEEAPMKIPTNFNKVTRKQIEEIAYIPNNRPGKSRGWRSPSPSELFKGQREDLLTA